MAGKQPFDWAHLPDLRFHWSLWLEQTSACWSCNGTPPVTRVRKRDTQA